jgi:lipopolysaccharide biosynthesis regulator YciM
MLQAHMEIARGNADAAMDACRRAVRQGPAFLPEILPVLLDAHRRSGRQDLLAELERLYHDSRSPALVLTLADELQREKGDSAAIEFLTEHVSGYADLAALERLLALSGPRSGSDVRTQAVYHAVRAVVDHLRSRQPDHQCEHCGFVARRLHWQCPSCKHWGSIKPVQPESIGGGSGSVSDRRIA